MKSLNKQKGAITVLTALLFPLLLACTGMAVDIGRLYMEKSRLQNIADAAVLAGLAELKKNPDFDLSKYKFEFNTGTISTADKAVVMWNDYIELKEQM